MPPKTSKTGKVTTKSNFVILLLESENLIKYILNVFKVQ